jgi:hypothetical protein
MLASLGANAPLAVNASPTAASAPLTPIAAPLSSQQVATALMDFAASDAAASGTKGSAAATVPLTAATSENLAAIPADGKGLQLMQAAGSSSGQAKIVQLSMDKEKTGTLLNQLDANSTQPASTPSSTKSVEKKAAASKSEAAGDSQASNADQSIASGTVPAAIATLTPIAPTPPVPAVEVKNAPEPRAQIEWHSERISASPIWIQSTQATSAEDAGGAATKQQSGGIPASPTSILASDQRSSAPSTATPISSATAAGTEGNIPPQAEVISDAPSLVAHTRLSATATAPAREETLPEVGLTASPTSLPATSSSAASYQLPEAAFAPTESLIEPSATPAPVRNLPPSSPLSTRGNLSAPSPAPSASAAGTLTLSPPSTPSTPLAESTVTRSAAQVGQHPAQPTIPGLNALPAATGGAGVNPAATDAAAIQGAAVLQPVSAEDAATISASNVASGGKSSTVGSSKAVRGVGGGSAHPSASHPNTQMSSGAGVDAAAIARDLSGGRGGQTATGESGRSFTGTASGPDTREVFATLDTENPTGRPTWVHAGAQQAEAGFQDPTLGWVGVRADATGGGVHAELVAGSADAAQALGGHMAGLNAYLADHHTPVESLTLTSSDGGRSGSDAGTAGQSMQQGAGQQSGQQSGQGAGQGTGQDVDLRLQVSTFPERSIQSTLSSGLSSEILAMNESALSTGQGGLHISVMA